MANLRGLELYEAAFERLKTGKSKVVDVSEPGFRFSTTTVAIEAGKKKGFIRADRYPDLCNRIKDEEERRRKSKKKPGAKKHSSSSKYDNLNEKYKALKRDYESCLEEMVNLIRLNYELKVELDRLRNNIVVRIDK